MATNNYRGPVGYDLINNANFNKGTAYTEDERREYKLHGLLPVANCNMDVQRSRALGNLRRKAHDIECYVFMQALQSWNERLFYHLVINHIEEFMPI